MSGDHRAGSPGDPEESDRGLQRSSPQDCHEGPSRLVGQQQRHPFQTHQNVGISVQGVFLL